MLNPRPNSISDSSGQEESSEDSTKLSSLDTVDIDPTLAQPLRTKQSVFLGNWGRTGQRVNEFEGSWVFGEEEKYNKRLGGNVDGNERECVCRRERERGKGIRQCGPTCLVWFVRFLHRCSALTSLYFYYHYYMYCIFSIFFLDSLSNFSLSTLYTLARIKHICTILIGRNTFTHLIFSPPSNCIVSWHALNHTP